MRKVSERQRQVGNLLLLGYHNQEIAKELKISPRTVKAHMRRLFEFYGVRDGIKRIKLAER
jgi:DNA-binding NarL/FixJ family response regulator